jgi:hypothetical protein
MQRVTLLSATVLIATASCCLIAPTARALGPAVAHADDALAPIASRADIPITGVTVYRSRAAVTRSGAPKLAQGVHELRVGPIPSFADLESVQAKIGEGAKLLDLKTETVALPAPSSDNPRVREALEAVDTARAALADVDRRISNNASSLKLIDSIAAKAASDASQSLGSALDPEKLRAQIAFVTGERDRLTAESLELARLRVKAAGELSAREQALARAGGAPPAERYALVTIAVPSGGAVPMSLTYLVANAVWSPTYTVRGDPSAGTLAIEFDAVVKQATGEDWTDVTLALSTAEPARAANPRTIDATYLSLYDPTQPPAVAAPAMAPGAPMNMSAKRRDPAGGGFGSAGEDKDAEAEFGEKLVHGAAGAGAAAEDQNAAGVLQGGGDVVVKASAFGAALAVGVVLHVMEVAAFVVRVVRRDASRGAAGGFGLVNAGEAVIDDDQEVRAGRELRVLGVHGFHKEGAELLHVLGRADFFFVGVAEDERSAEA